MSINLTQDFCFETDDIKSLEAMLSVAVSVMFHIKSGEYIKLHIKGKHPGLSFDDGIDSYERYWEGREDGVVLPDGTVALLKDSRIYAGCQFNEISETFTGRDARDRAAEFSIQKQKLLPKPKPKRMWVATLSDYASDIEDSDSCCKNHNEMVQFTVNRLEEVLGKKREFYELCGDGYNAFFNRNDGSIDIGFRLQYRPQGGWNLIDVSLTHIYYGK